MGDYVNDVKACVKKVDKLEMVFTKMLTDEINDAEFPKLFEQVDSIDASYDEVIEWAPKFGIELPASRKRRRSKAPGAADADADYPKALANGKAKAKGKPKAKARK